MNITNLKKHESNHPELTLSDDGLIRMTYEEFRKLSIFHYFSEIELDSESECDTEIVMRGFTEWITKTKPTISIGWDWKLESSSSSPYYSLDGTPFSNLMFIDENKNNDVGKEITTKCLMKYIANSKWQKEVMDCLSERYS